MKLRIAISLLVFAILAGGSWYQWQVGQYEATAKQAMVDALRLIKDIANARGEMKTARLQAADAAKLGDLVKQRQIGETMKLLEIKISKAKQQLRQTGVSSCGIDRALSDAFGDFAVDKTGQETEKSKQLAGRDIESNRGPVGCGQNG
jgi:hypothetical protein